MSTTDEDGVVRGAEPLVDPFSHEWPPRPTDLRPITPKEREKIYGTFKYRPSPVSGNPEQIWITSTSNFSVSTFEVPQLSKYRVPGTYKDRVTMNSLVKESVRALFSDWESEGLMIHVRAWSGGYAPRFVRGSTVNLSNHSWGTAFDINAQWNMLGQVPALLGDPGSVRALVDLAAKNGWYWGGWFQDKPDGMHFEMGVRL